MILEMVGLVERTNSNWNHSATSQAKPQAIYECMDPDPTVDGDVGSGG